MANGEFELKVRPRPKETVILDIPLDTLQALSDVANSRDMSVEALIKVYVGQGLRQDLSRLLADRVLETTETVLARHLQSEDDVTSIMREIRGAISS